MAFDRNLLLSKLQPEDQLEKVGFVLTNGSIVEVENICHDPENGFDVRGEDILKHEDSAEATWHTHPGCDSNLSVGDHETFLGFPHLAHYIIGIDGIRCFKVEKGRVLVA
jgi:proteasome lid subunit RPN8/RPN11